MPRLLKPPLRTRCGVCDNLGQGVAAAWQRNAPLIRLPFAPFSTATFPLPSRCFISSSGLVETWEGANERQGAIPASLLITSAFLLAEKTFLRIKLGRSRKGFFVHQFVFVPGNGNA